MKPLEEDEKVKKDTSKNWFLDIETCKGPDGNEFPYLVCVIDENNERKEFWGYSCIDNFNV